MINRLSRVILPWLLLIGIATPALCELPSGNMAPGFTLLNPDGKTVRLSDYQGRPVILIIGTTWCPGCKAQLSVIEENRRFFDDHDIAVVDVFIQETARTVGKYLRGKKLPGSFEALLDNGQVHRAYRVYPIPRLLILDGSGRIVQDTLGLDGDELTGALRRLVEKQPDATSGSH